MADTAARTDRDEPERMWIVLGQIHPMPGGGRALIQVSASDRVTFPAELGAKLAAVVRENWPHEKEPDA